jgi:micrococcal nuclease
MNTTRRRRRRRTVSLLGLALSLLLLYLQTNRRPPAMTTANQPGPAITTTDTIPTPTGLVEAATDAVLDAQPGLAHVTKDVDGDTIDVVLGGKAETVRFIGIDTPETHDPRKPVQCFGEVAAARTKALLEGKDVRLEADPTNSDRDKYGRLLRYVYLPNGTLVNAQLIREGYAFAYTVFPFIRLDEFQGLETAARQDNVGLWKGCNINESEQIKQTTGNK